MELTESFWNQKYIEEKIAWDLGKVSPPIKHYIDQVENKKTSILIPGAGNSYEAEYLWKKGFSNVTVLDISFEALRRFKERVPSFPENQMVHADFFQFSGKFDLIIEQTFFCAIEKKRRPSYVRHSAGLLRKESKLVGLLFHVPLNEEQPPFGGNEKEYKRLFEPYFKIQTFQKELNSVDSRKGKELWVEFVKK